MAEKSTAKKARKPYDTIRRHNHPGSAIHASAPLTW